MSIEWLKLRSYNGSVNNAFEELVCQLARVENIPDRVKFLRIGAPDGGVEAYSISSNNEEIGWQAKYFLSMSNAQWNQVEKSYKTALEKHPNLTRYIICIPLDRQDPRIDNEEWFMDKWNQKVSEWKGYAQAKGRNIDFEYWGTSEIFDRLSKPENAGKLHFWFEKVEFSDRWFTERLHQSIRNLDKRYTPKLNFNLPIAETFEGLSRGSQFYEMFQSHLDNLIKAYHKANSHIQETKVEDIKNITDKITNSISQFLALRNKIDFDEIKTIEQSEIYRVLSSCLDEVNLLISKFFEIHYESSKKEKKDPDYEVNKYGWDIEYYRKFSRALNDFLGFINGSTVTLSNNPFLLLSGEAGTGKSHLLADIGTKRLESGQFTILLLGQHFNSDEPWSQIINLLHLQCDRDTFLGALNAKGESLGSRILFFIDAINEGDGKNLWKHHIAGIISVIKKFPWVGLVFSVRSSYEKLIVPESIVKNRDILRVVHNGFAGHEYEASKLFFDNYRIKQPSVPLLNPEFSNPLFLKLFCEGLNKKGLTEIPDGYEGISTIINFYLDAINATISAKKRSVA